MTKFCNILFMKDFIGLAPVVIALLFCFVLHVSVGAKYLPMTSVYEALIDRDPGNFHHMIIWDLRLPRALIAIAVGAALSVSGALMQGVTRNPLAEPGILGLLSGASFAVVVATHIFGPYSPIALPWIAALGALGAASIVYTVARSAPGGITPLTLTLSGAILTALMGAIISVLHLLDQDSFDNLRIWLSGSLSARRPGVLVATGPVLLLALAMAFGLARQVTALSMGDDLATGLGVPTGRLKFILLVIVVSLSACAVALAGPLVFIGLIIPHAVRMIVGSDYRWIVPYSALVGAIYLLIIDIIARVLLAPQEISTGILTAMIGAPLFIQLVRNKAR